MSSDNALTASLEDYLEAILNIVAEKQAVRAKDISERLNVSNSSVTGALHSLAEKEFINYAPYDVITLTEKGKDLGQQLVRRHEALRNFFVKVLGIDDGQAEDAACRMEHAVTGEIFERFIRFAEHVDTCPLWTSSWTKDLGQRCEYGVRPAQPEGLEHCEECVAHCLGQIRQRRKEVIGE
jgi:DtxR family Mn-dependent transcriptional regulator